MSRRALTSTAVRWLVLMSSGCGADIEVPAGIYSSPTVVDFGTVQDSNTVSGQFTISNTTDTAVTILDVKVGCGCTTAELSSETILPNSTMSVMVTADLTNRYGKQSFQTVLTTDSERDPFLFLGLAGRSTLTEISGEVPIDIGVFSAGIAIDEEVVLSKGDTPGASVVQVEHLSGQLLLSPVIPGEVSDRFHSFRVTGRAPQQSGAFLSKAQITASDADWVTKTVVVRGVVKGRWVVPHQYYLGFVKLGSEAEGIILIEPESEMSKANRADVTNVRVSIDHPGFAVESRLVPSGAIEIELKLLKSSSAGAVEAKLAIEIETADGLQEAVVIPVFARIIPSS